MQNIGQGVLKNLWVAVPPIDGQIKIVEKLKAETRSLVFTISRTEREIDLLREYRTRLIADVVTGKLDVREAAARLPDAAEEIEGIIPDEGDEETSEEVEE